MAKGIYMVTMDGMTEEVASIKEVGQLLGHKVTKKDVLSGNIAGVEFVEDATMEDYSDDSTAYDYSDEAMDDVSEDLDKDIDEDDVEPDTPADAGHFAYGDDANENPALGEDTTDEDSALTNTNEDTTDTVPTSKQKLANQEVEYPEVGHFDTEKALKKFYKQLSDVQVAEWVELEGLEYKPCDHQAINRMRMCMAILEHHFPKPAKTKGKAKSKYADYTNEQLVAMLQENNLEVPDTKGSEQILRMRAIMTLREAKLIG